MPKLDTKTLTDLAIDALESAGANPSMAAAAARMLVEADLAGLASHGVSRIPFYAAMLRNGRAVGTAKPEIAGSRGAVCLVDNRDGLPYESCALAVDLCIARAREFGIGFAGITNSGHAGAMALHLAPVSEANLVGIALTNSPAAIPAWGGRRPLFGTNPVAAVFPREEAEPLVIDLSLSVTARGKIVQAAQKGEAIPEGWALDAEGWPTTDPQAALGGSMVALGGAKGAVLAMAFELLCCALTGAAFGFEADSFFADEGNRPRIGQAFLAIDPGALAGLDVYFARVDALCDALLKDGARLPGARRSDSRARALQEGIAIPEALHSELLELAARESRA